MRAVAVRRFGERPAPIDLPPPSPGPDELSVRLEFAGVNPFDWKIADGLFRDRRPHRFPLVLGVDGAGVVEGVGPGVARFRVGDRVAGQFLHDPVGVGTYAERTAVPEANALAAIPDSLSSRDAAALPTAGMTAVEALDLLALPERGRLAVVGASGGIGSFVLPLASRAGHEVIAIARAGSEARLRALGATQFVDLSGPDPVGTLRALVPGGVDGLLDLASDADGFRRWSTAVRPSGAAGTTVYVAPAVASVRSFNIDLQPTAARLERLIRSVVAGDVRPAVDRVVSLAEAPDVVDLGRTGGLRGKTVIDIARVG